MRNLAAKLIGEGGMRLSSTLFVLLLARELGAAHFGLYSTAYSFAALFIILVDLGINSIVTREIARQPADRSKIVRAANLIKGIAAILAMAGIHIASRWSDFASAHRALVDALGVVVINYSLIDYMGALLAGIEEMEWEATMRILCRVIIVTAG